MSAFERLLDLQEHDTKVDQLRHRRETFPERAELVAANAALANLAVGIGELEAQRHELATRQGRIEDEVAGIEAKIASEDKALYSGTVTSPRELQAMQADIDSLKRRQSTLEDDILALMEEVEPVDGALGARDGERVELEAQILGLEATIVALEAEVDAELEAVSAERDALAGEVGDDLLGEYEGMRKRFAGVAVARLVGGACGGCHLSLSAVEVDRIRKEPPDARIYCEECGRILVRP